MRVIEEFWIINWDGMPLFKYSPIKDLKVGFVSGFFSAIQSLANNFEDTAGDTYISNIRLGDSNYKFLNNPTYKLFFILKSSDRYKKKNIEAYLKKLEESFIEEYKDYIIDFDGNISLFEKFQIKINKSYGRIACPKISQPKKKDIEQILNKYKNAVSANKLSPKQAIIEPEKFMKTMNTKDKLKSFLKIMPKAISSIRNAKLSYKTIKNNPEKPNNNVSKEFLEEFEKFAYDLGIGKIGYTEITPNLVYKGCFVLFPNVIVLAIEMDKDKIKKAPSFETYTMIINTYKKLNKITNILTKFLREHNYSAQAGPALGGVANYVVLAQNAGLGWIGKLGLLITPEFGPRQRLSVIFTNIENLPVNKINPHSWIENVCRICRECIEACPGKAIFEKPIIGENGQYMHIDNSKCFPHFYKDYGCTVCIKRCKLTFIKYNNSKKKI
ncbi:MAG: hypothetical protein ACFFAH_11565 [Promethearchaeota archaeon]